MKLGRAVLTRLLPIFIILIVLTVVWFVLNETTAGL